MAFWRKKEQEFEMVDRMVNEHPGIKPAEIAKQLEVSPSTITRRLPSLEEIGYLYSEDERGGLWPFGRRKKK
jgi:Mn-dependent DtxR family transcriptional regulator